MSIIEKDNFEIHYSDDFEIIDKLSKKNKKSYNYIVNSMIKFAIENMDTSEIKEIKKMK